MIWKQRSLEECCDLITDGTHHSPPTSSSGPHLYLTSKNVRPWRMELDDVSYVTTTVHDEIFSRCPVQLGDVLYVKDGVNAGTAAINTISEPYSLLSSVAVIRPRRELLDARYLVHWLNDEHNQDVLLGAMSGSAIRRLVLRQIRRFVVPLPPVAEQRRIADILDKADAIRRKRKEAIALTEDLLRSAFLEIVGPAARDYVRWPVRTIESLAASTPNAMRTGPFGSDLRHSEFVDSGIAVLGIDNAVQNRFAWGERRFISEAKYAGLRRYTVYPGDVIVTIMGTTGRSAVVPRDIPTAITTKHLATITLDRDQADPEFVSQALFRHPEVMRQILAANRGAIMSGLNLGLIKALRIPVPPIERQRAFAEMTSRIRAISDEMSTKDDSEMLFQALVARAFSGSGRAVEER